MRAVGLHKSRESEVSLRSLYSLRSEYVFCGETREIEVFEVIWDYLDFYWDESEIKWELVGIPFRGVDNFF